MANVASVNVGEPSLLKLDVELSPSVFFTRDT